MSALLATPRDPERQRVISEAIRRLESSGHGTVDVDSLQGAIPAVPHGGDMADQQTALDETKISVSRLEVGYSMSKAVRTALRAVLEGWFGTCSECGEDIPTKRLKVAFWATMCVPCQEELEKYET